VCPRVLAILAAAVVALATAASEGCFLGPAPCEPPRRVTLAGDGRFVAIAPQGRTAPGEPPHPHDDARDMTLELDRAAGRAIVSYVRVDGRRVEERYRVTGTRWMLGTR